MGPRELLRAVHADEAGQSVVIVALAFTVLLGFGGLAIDGGRYYAERRFLQSAVDAAALGCVSRMNTGGTQTQAEEQGKTILRTYNLPGDPTGTGVVVSETPLYNTWFNLLGSADKRNLYDGVDAGPTDCRVAVQAALQTFFIRLFGIQSISVPANAHAVAKGGMLPVIVNRYKDPPGPSSTFIDYTKQETYQDSNPRTCYEGGYRVDPPGSSPPPVPIGTCPDAAEGTYTVDLAAGTVTCSVCLWGPETIIAGQGYNSTDSDFRGFIGLDIRDFSTVDLVTGQILHEFYNGADTMNQQQLKAQEAAYVNGGYPGPDLVEYIPGSNPVQKGLQVATMSGNSAGVVVSSFMQYARIGEKILVQIFDGQVREIPDFTVNAPSAIAMTSPMGPGAGGPVFRVGANQRFRENNDWVDLALLRDTFNNGANDDTPAGFHETSATFSPDTFTPAGGSGTQVTLQDLWLDGGVPTGIYSARIQGTGHAAPNPGGIVTSTHQTFVPINVGGVVKDFGMNLLSSTAEVATGETAVYAFTLTTGSGGAAWGNSAVSVALDRGTCASGYVALVALSGTTECVAATISASPDFVPRKNGPPTVTVSVPTSLIPVTTYTLVIRARGTNADGQPVVHVKPVSLAIGTSGGTASKYVNVQGYVAFLITSMSTNTVYGRAISGYYANPKDPALNLVRKAGLIPWEAAPCNDLGLPCP